MSGNPIRAVFRIDVYPNKTSQLTNDSGFIDKTVSNLENYTKTEDLAPVALDNDYNSLINKPDRLSLFDNDTHYVNDSDVNIAINEHNGSQTAHPDIRGLISQISVRHALVDIVADHNALNSYDTSRLLTNDMIKVLADETEGNKECYWEWDGVQWQLRESEGPYYTTTVADATFVKRTVKVNGHALNGDITIAYNELPGIPTIGSGILTIQQNQVDKGSFGANATGNTTVNIEVPVSISDLEDDTLEHPIAKAGTLTGLTSTVSELNKLHGSPVSKSDFDKIAGLTANATQLNILNGATITTQELNYVKGVTSSIQAQLNSKMSTADMSNYELKANVTSKGSATVPVYFDAGGVATPITSYNGTAARATADAAGNNIADTYTKAANLMGKGSETVPIYIDANGLAKTITSYSGNAATATKATQDGNGNNIVSFYEPIESVRSKGSATLPIYFTADGIATPITSYQGNAATATKATQDGSGNTITSYYVAKNDVKSKGSASLPVYFDANGKAQTITSYSGTSDKANKDGSGNTITSYYEPKSNVTNKGNATTPVYFNSSGVATPITSYGGNAATATKATQDGSGNTITSYYEPKANVTSKGSASLPVYFDTNGVAQTITSYQGNAATATKATQDASGNTITSYYEPKANVSSKGNATTPVYFNSSGVATPITSYGGTAARATADASGNTITSFYVPKNNIANKGSATLPVYIDSSGAAQTITSYQGTAARATADGNGNNIVNTYATQATVNNKQDKVSINYY